MTYSREQMTLIVEELKPVNTDSMYDDMLDECYGTVTIAGYEYATSLALKELDPVAYRCGMADYIDSEITNGTLTDEIDGEYYNQSEVNDLDLGD